MVTFYIIASTIALAVIFAAFKFLQINFLPPLISTVVAMLLSLMIFPIASSIEYKNDTSFKEYWNGSETQAYLEDVACVRDGHCQNTYKCDPYITTESYVDGNGNVQTQTVTEYHSCPYSNQETTYVVETTLGGYQIGAHLMTGTPFRAGTAIPGGQVTEPPALWTEAKNRIDNNKHGGVTKINTYENVILSSDTTILKQYSNEVEDYKSKNLLPPPAQGTYDYYKSYKAAYVNTTDILDPKIIEKQLPYFNAMFGVKYHGDLRMIFVDANEITDPTKYAHSLHAYWLDPAWEQYRIAKNSLVVIVGVENYKTPKKVEPAEEIETTTTTPTAEETVVPEPVEEKPVIKEGTPVVAWATGFTGMPIGNEGLLEDLESLAGTPVDSNFIGTPLYSESYASSGGALEEIVTGTNSFQRVSMSGEEENDNGSGFGYLKAEWQPSTGVYVGSMIGAAFAIITGLGIGIGISINTRQ